MQVEEDVTRLLADASAGDTRAFDRLVAVVYAELRRLAHRRLLHERSDHTLGTTGLVHEAYLRLLDIRKVSWQDRAHFLAMASRVMRRVLVDYARQRGAAKREGSWSRVDADEKLAIPPTAAEAILDLDRALERLERIAPRKRQIVEQRYFGGLTLEETAQALALSPTTVKRELRFARAFLCLHLGGEAAEDRTR